MQPGEVQARHILLIPDDRLGARGQRAARSRTRSGGSCSAARRSTRCSGLLHDPSAEKQADNVPADKLPEAYAKAIGDADSGAVVPVFALPGAGTREQFVVAAGHRHGGRRATSATRTCATGSASSSASSSPSGATSTGCARHVRGHTVERPPVTCGRASPSRSATRAASVPRSPRARSRSRSTAEITVVGAEDQIAAIPAARRIGVGTWGLGSGERAEDRARAIRAGRIAGHAVETAVEAGARRARWTRSSPRRPTSTPSTWRASPIPGTPSGWRSSPATWTWR